MSSSEIRKAQEQDLDAIYRLAFQLDYQPNREELRKNLLKILNHPDYEVLVLEVNQEVLGWMTLQARFRIEDVPFLQVTAIVTDEKHRGSGFGKKLLAYAEDRAQASGFSFIGLYSNKRRLEAHQFYRNRGYTESKESFFFVKKV